RLTGLLLLFFIAGWSIAVGVFQIIGAIQLRKQIDNEWMLILGGALSVLFGIALFVAPGAGALALVWLIGSYAILFGILNIASRCGCAVTIDRGAFERPAKPPGVG